MDALPMNLSYQGYYTAATGETLEQAIFNKKSPHFLPSVADGANLEARRS
jgi:hypothetical protein